MDQVESMLLFVLKKFTLNFQKPVKSARMAADNPPFAK